MGESGILHEDDRVELVAGEIVEMTPIGSRHAASVKRLNHLLSERSTGRAILGVQDPLGLSDRDEPQPDVVLLRPRDDFYAGGHPRPEDVLLVIEVADSSLSYDLGVKVPLYAARGIPEVWIVDVGGERLHIFREPTGDSYRRHRELGRGDSVGPLELSMDELEVADILP